MITWGRGLAALTAVVSVLLEIAAHDAAHVIFWWHGVPAFDLAYGLAGCVAIIVLSKALGASWLQRPEDYYREDRR